MSSNTAKTVASILRNATLSAREQEDDEKAAAIEHQMLGTAFLIEEISEHFDEADINPLAALGVEIEDDDGMFILTKGIHSFIVEPAEDGALLVNGEPVYSSEPFYTDALYQDVFKRIADWAVKIDDEESA